MYLLRAFNLVGLGSSVALGLNFVGGSVKSRLGHAEGSLRPE